MDEARAAGLDTQQTSPISSVFLFESEHESDNDSLPTTVAETVMAEQVTKDVVKEAQSVGRPAPIDDTASTTNTPAVNGELPSGPATANSTSDQHSRATDATSADVASAKDAHVSGTTQGAVCSEWQARDGRN
jgi:hypothetical protein